MNHADDGSRAARPAELGPAPLPFPSGTGYPGSLPQGSEDVLAGLRFLPSLGRNELLQRTFGA